MSILLGQGQIFRYSLYLSPGLTPGLTPGIAPGYFKVSSLLLLLLLTTTYIVLERGFARLSQLENDIFKLTDSGLMRKDNDDITAKDPVGK